jgi:hypothetical protein
LSNGPSFAVGLLLSALRLLPSKGKWNRTHAERGEQHQTY